MQPASLRNDARVIGLVGLAHDLSIEGCGTKVRMLPDGHLAVKAYGRPSGGGRSPYVSFPVPDDPALAALVEDAGRRAGAMWSAHRGLR